MEKEPITVPAEAKRGGETGCKNWSWVEPCVWTERMLAALSEGVKGGKWFSLIDKVCSPANLHASFREVKERGGAAGVDHQGCEMMEQHLEEELAKLAKGLRDGSYYPQAVRRVWIEKPGTTQKRPLGVPTVRDRVVQKALQHVIEPIFERDFAEQSYGFRPGRGCKDALRRVDSLLKAGMVWVVDADLQSYFDTIPQDKLMERVKEKVSDGQVIALIEAFLRQGVMESGKEWTPEAGTPQGAVISPLLSNIYLDELDHLMEEKGVEMVRYADDLVLMCRSEEEAKEAYRRLQEWTADAGLLLHPEKTRIVDATQRGGFDFLGYHFEQGRKYPRKKSLKKLREKIKALTRRNNGKSLEEIIKRLNPILRGWMEYFKHSHPSWLRRIDGWLRGRLRAILRRRMKLRGRARGEDHQRWPNAFFTKHGLYSLAAAYEESRQSCRR
jgi:RNA-directed DNA polymerase